MKKYELVPQENTNLFRIRALRDIPEINVKAGDLGGYIEEECNLSHGGSCWVYEYAVIHGNARVYDNARVYGNAIVRGYARVFGNASISGRATIYDNAVVHHDSIVYGNAQVCGSTNIETGRVTKCFHVQTLAWDVTFTDTHVYIGCKTLTWEEWAEKGLEIGKKECRTDRDLKHFLLLFQAYSIVFEKDLKFPIPDSVK
jgi:NDP-sugar pyrophosphorylase family protein